MKKITLVLIVSLSLGLFEARAQDISNPVQSENNFRNTLWFNTENAAGMAFRPLSQYNDLDFAYNVESGDWHALQQPSSLKEATAKSSGATNLGKFRLWGDFAFRNIFTKGSKLNAILYDIENDMPYYVADTSSSGWRKQEYDMSAKIASPILWNSVSFGMSLRYLSKVGAKQKDPRTETYNYSIEAVPSAVWKISGRQTIGFNAYFDHTYERSEPSTRNNYREPMVFLTKGLGQAQVSKVGGNDGIKKYYYDGWLYGAGLQYGYENDSKILTEINYVRKTVDVFQNPVVPKSMGSTAGNALYGSFQMLFGQNKSDKIYAEGSFKTTDGNEKLQKLISDAHNQHWETVSTSNMSKYQSAGAKAGYDHQTGAGDNRGYDWNYGLDMTYSMVNDEYYIPETTFGWSSVAAEAYGARFFKFKSSNLLARLCAGYSHSLSGSYDYASDTNIALLQTMYKEDIGYYTDDFIKTSGRITYTVNAQKVNYVFDLSADCRFTVGSEKARNRYYGLLSFGIIF
ncbi:MAG: DUF3575 domain-containing protein [Bacteroidales bacterium]|jgi:hypothetical protein|nr:DUF3575 domain-containing protein [Bacteroidales bacterium]MCI1785286.1 DUF3575 domain-containing protein [Bacteroidales bacterium]